jgi:hypothetical protein
MTSLCPYSAASFAAPASSVRKPLPQFGADNVREQQPEAAPAETAPQAESRLPKLLQKLVAQFQKGQMPEGSVVELKTFIHQSAPGHFYVSGGRPALLGYTERVSFDLEVESQDKALAKALSSLDTKDGYFEVTGAVTKKPGFWVGQGRMSVDSIKQVSKRTTAEDGTTSWNDESKTLYSKPQAGKKKYV